MHKARSTSSLRLALLLPLLMLLAQQAAWLHQLGHAAYSAQAQVLVQQSDDCDLGNACPTCQGFSQISFAASITAPQLVFQSPGYQPGDEPQLSVIAATQPSARSRGPPANA